MRLTREAEYCDMGDVKLRDMLHQKAMEHGPEKARAVLDEALAYYREDRAAAWAWFFESNGDDKHFSWDDLDGGFVCYVGEARGSGPSPDAAVWAARVDWLVREASK